MKNILTLLLTFGILLTGFSQTQSNSSDSVKQKPFMTYYSFGGGFSPGSKTQSGISIPTWGSIEVGCWGVEKPVMYGLSLDFSPDNADYTKLHVWAGIKAYYQIYQASNYYLFTYVAPKTDITQQNVSLEFGLANYARISKHVYSSVMFGYAKSSLDEQNSPVFSLGLNLVY